MPYRKQKWWLEKGEQFENYFDILIIKSYKKPMTRNIEEGTFIISYQGKILNPKNEWHQPKIIRTTVVQGGAEMIGGEVQIFQRDGGSRTTAGGAGGVDDGVIARSVDQSVRHQVSTRSQTTA